MRIWGSEEVKRSLARRREIMLRDHLLGRGIRSGEVMRAMEEVPRESFIDEGLMDSAYDDNPLPIDEGQTISQPYIVAYMTEALQLQKTDRVLEIGTGSGYAAAVLSRIVTEVFSVERLGSLAESARRRLQSLGYDNVFIHEGDGTQGWAEHAPYDAIVVTAGAPHVPPTLLKQLAIGGRLVIPVGPIPEFQVLLRLRRLGGDEFRREELCGVRFVPLIGAEGW